MDDFKKYQSNQRSQPRYNNQGNPPGNQDSNRNNLLDEDDEDVDMIKTRIGEVKQESLNSTRNALSQLRQTEDTAGRTMEKLGQQSAQLNKVDKSLDVTNVRADESIDKTANLRKLNKSIFSISFGNPFSGRKKREAELEKAKLAQERSIQESERIRKQDYDSRRRVENATQGLNRAGPGRSKLSDQDRAKYTFEDEDPEIENEINDNLNEIGDAVGGLKRLALGMGEEIETQNKQLANIQAKTDDTSAKIAISQHHLRKIK
ncbi:hypothetical protein BB559_001964 [Furculomyces boomerangus]|uniref:t-SNARE coiled-coil homology domain-containing protein n=2 Tax=Harpellales TaxID=61421 RepID=A0A2T9YYZ4_9FUNG|nr:hypothetical protein BB559_001964 [Furculomyces boomerangus]PVZ98224.1 hypothetical protein BB558_005773 [Smittium angustum]